MSSPAPAPQRTSRAATAAAPARPLAPKAPPLRVVDDAPARDERTRRTPFGALGVVLVGCLFIGVFGVVVFQALMMQTQSRLDVLDNQVTAQEGRSQQLNRQRADLESPDRIVAAATRLNMVKPPDVQHLQPGASDDQNATYDANAPAPKPVTPTTKVAPVTTAPPVATTAVPTTTAGKATTPTTKAGTKATTPTTKAGTKAPTTKATTPTTKATTPTTKAKTATTKAATTR